MLRICNLKKSYPQRGTVLNGLNLELNEGETIAVTGPSGSGKTTLLNLTGLLDRPDSGEIFFKDKLINSYTSDEAANYRNRQIGFIFQDHMLLPYLTVMENILLPLSAKQLSDDEYFTKVKYSGELMDKTGISNLAAKYPWQVSGGEAQRAALVRALVNRPALLLADEPTGSLDAGNAEILGNLLRDISLQYRTAVILATHSMTLAKKMSVIYRIENGKLVRI